MTLSRTPAAARRWLAAHAASQRGWLGLAALTGIAAGALTVAQMALLAWIVSRLLVDGAPLASLTSAFLMLVAVLATRALCQWGQELSGQLASLRIRHAVRAELLDHLAAMGPVRAGARHSAGLANQLVEQVEALDGYFARFLPQLRLCVAIPLLILLVVLWLDWLAALFLLLAAPLIPLFMALVGMGAERLNRDQFVAVSRLSGHFLDRVRGISTLQLFGRTREAATEVHAAADNYRRLSMRTLRVAFLSSAVLEFFASVAIAVVAIYVGFGLLGYIEFGPAEELTLFSGLLVLLLAPEFFQPLRTLAQHYHDRAAALGAADGMLALLSEPVRPAHATASPPPALERCVALEAVTLSHPGRGQVLGPLDVVVEKGDILVVTGPSGAGKSALLQLLAGFVAPASGQRHAAADLRIAWMDQRPLLIHGSLAENLRLAAPEASDAELERALEHAGLAELVAALPQGIHTPLGERGSGLSGGQAQRLALARVFLSDAELVLLDEPTASLDEVTEACVIESLRRLGDEGRTLVIATHHPALMAMSSRRLALHDGRKQAVVAAGG
ncbi:thiol reductant ABC exporter subunit CydD [Billgrantia kenyensis]|uniref:Thiol reductant ABC exporter subunit CydD n=1 Tax=Billgrantia kenyensis TaxID=321266 RepID=A0A7W0ABW3_9GAMM|nr:thiol reductant ABC exporter subunit CydD [Halomonas kenyensis]MBA2777591.1 thiol reductant ABC exporter subunit CydD [Halomonas kenyensis]MCG6660261.1 thiol reductant ABC exporter subunit CydD [Halomonas kenyensis]